MDNLRFMMDDASRFAAAHGLQKEARQIRSMVLDPSIKTPHTHEVRKGCFVELFETRGLIDAFVSKYWPKRHTPEGEKRRQLYLDQKALNERLLSGLDRTTGCKEVLDLVADEDEESSFCEGRESYRTHRTLERDPGIAKKAKVLRLQQQGDLRCEVCGFCFFEAYGIYGSGYIEAHHTIPVSKLRGKKKTKVTDIALVCANCHRVLHKAKPSLTVSALRKIVEVNVQEKIAPNPALQRTLPGRLR